MKCVGYIRVSTDKQDYANQEKGILDSAKLFNTAEVEFIEETVSGKISWRQRELGKLVSYMEKGDVLIVSELSRLGRSLIDVLEILREFTNKQVIVYCVKGGYKLNGGDLQTTILTTVMGLAAQIERELISMRTKEALQRKKAEGMKLGRPKGNGRSRLDQYNNLIISDKNNGMTIQQLANKYQSSWTNMKNYLKKKNNLHLFNRVSQ